MDLNDDFLTLKMSYRKIFEACAKDIQVKVEKSSSVEEVKNYFYDVLIPNMETEKKNICSTRFNFNCVGCGVCCRFAVSEFSPEQLKEKAQNGDKFASQFIKTFVPYESLKDAKIIFPEYIEMLEKQKQSGYYVYHCPKITEDNRCPDYENRPQICRDFPDNPIAFLPKSCGYLWWKLQSESVLLKLNAEAEIINFYLNKFKGLD